MEKHIYDFYRLFCLNCEIIEALDKTKIGRPCSNCGEANFICVGIEEVAANSVPDQE